MGGKSEKKKVPFWMRVMDACVKKNQEYGCEQLQVPQQLKVCCSFEYLSKMEKKEMSNKKERLLVVDTALC